MQITSSISPARQLWIQRRQALSEMIGSIQSGDIAAAQKDLAQVHQANTGLGLDPAAHSAPGSNYGVRNRIDFTALYSAVQSGDLNAAQTAWSAIESNRPDPPALGTAATQSGAMAQDIAGLLADIAAGNIAGMSQNGSAVAAHLQVLLGERAPDMARYSQAETAAAARLSLASNLKALVTAAQSGDLQGAQALQQQIGLDVAALQEPLTSQDGPQTYMQHGAFIAARLLP